MGTTQTSLAEFSRNKVLTAVENLFTNSEPNVIVDVIGQLLFYSSNPDYAKDLEKSAFASLTNKVMTLLASIMEVYVTHEDYLYYLKTREAA